MRHFYVLVILAACLRITLARPAEIILLRHAEKPPDESSAHLSAQGRERARALVPFLTTNPALVTNGPPVALFATQPSRRGHGLRTRETLEPLAKHLNLRIETPFSARDYSALAKRVLHDPAYDGKTVVICWVHDCLPQLAAELRVKHPPAAWKGSTFDRVWVITYREKKATLRSLPQNLLPGDSPE